MTLARRMDRDLMKRSGLSVFHIAASRYPTAPDKFTMEIMDILENST